MERWLQVILDVRLDISFPGLVEIEFTRPMQQFQPVQHVYLFQKQEGWCGQSVTTRLCLGSNLGSAWLSTRFRLVSLGSLSFAQCRNSKNVVEQKSTLTVNQIGAWCTLWNPLVMYFYAKIYVTGIYLNMTQTTGTIWYNVSYSRILRASRYITWKRIHIYIYMYIYIYIHIHV